MIPYSIGTDLVGESSSTSIEIVQMLLNAGACIYLLNDRDVDAFDIANSNGHVHIANMLNVIRQKVLLKN